jgi:Immunoglobulin-like domain of bacterial spore germination
MPKNTSRSYVSLLWIFVILLIVGVVWYFSSAEPENNLLIDDTELETDISEAVSDMIRIDAPVNKSMITSPLMITGTARGMWYFEASFPIELRDANNTIIATTIGTAQGEWMTENFVPFTASLTFPPQPTGSIGTLILRKDNPSGEPQNDAQYVVDVVF